LSWAQSLYDTYCACETAVGICLEDSQARMLLPVGHTLIEPDYIITIREDGSFIEAVEIPKGKNTTRFFVAAPCTDNSSGRSGKNAKDCPHPLFDQAKYLSSPVYGNNLSHWLAFLRDKPEYDLACRVLAAVHGYVTSGVLETDIPEAKDETTICFCVNLAGENENRLWRMPELWKAWIDYYQGSLSSESPADVCYISGDRLPYTEKHPKAINRFAGNAKLISGNDSANFTFRGRFQEASQAATASYAASQRVHQALRWLIANRGAYCGSQAIVAWAVDRQIEVEEPLESSDNIFRSEVVTDSDRLTEAESSTDMDYGLALRRALASAGNANRLKDHTRRIALLAVNAATTGRLSITYYREMPEPEYHERIVGWHEQCSWYQPPGAGRRCFIGTPSAKKIVKAVLGKKPDGGSESYDKMETGIRERLLHCIMDGERTPQDMLNAALHRASNPLGLENTKDASRWQDWEEVFSVACGLWRRHYYEEGDEYQLSLEENRTDRDYLYGQLLAVADRIESHARYKQGKTKEDARPTNAVRYMSAFSQRPFRTWKAVWDQINPYIQQLEGAEWYMEQIQSIMGKFREGEYESDRPLDGRYLMGYFLQRRALRKGDKNNDGGNENESDE
jgi:CRISPR-associated protein Csd1